MKTWEITTSAGTKETISADYLSLWGGRVTFYIGDDTHIAAVFCEPASVIERDDGWRPIIPRSTIQCS